MQPLQFVMRIQISIHAPAKGATESYDEAYKTSMSFQSTLPRRERLETKRIGGKYNDFNPRSREGSDAHYLYKGVVYGPFQSTLPRRERLRPRVIMLENVEISIHAPAKGATELSGHISCLQTISIHAPAKGATITFRRIKMQNIISIHAPAKGATGTVAFLTWMLMDFNPRSREGSDL